jgi:hypothetical protein
MTYKEALKQFEMIYDKLNDDKLLRPSYVAALSAVKSTLKVQAAAEKSK